ncbi:MAG: DNA translocase FtsK 4TM domain-containing protein, partial [Planctomycetota bacterium]
MGEKTDDTESAEGLKSLFKKEMLNEMAALSMLLVVAFLILSIVSYDPADVAGATWPLNEQPQNLGGRFGAVIVDLGYTFLGVSTYLFIAVLGIYGTLVFFRRRAADWPVRLLGTFMLVVTFAALFGNSYGESGVMPSRGGVIGNAAFGVLNENFGLTGTYLVLSFMALLSFLLATDVLFYPIIRDLLHPLGNENEISGPLESPVISEPIMVSDEDEAIVDTTGKSWVTRIFRKGDPDDRQAESAEDDDGEIDFDPSPVLIPRDEPAPKAKTKTKARGRRTRAVKPTPETDQDPAEAADWTEGMTSYKLPEVSILTPGKKKDTASAKAELQRNAEIIRQVYSAFKISVTVVNYTRGPTVTTYEMEIPTDVMINKITRYKENLALNLRVKKVRMVTSAGK